MEYPKADEEEKILAASARNEKPEIRKILSAKAIVNLQKLVNSVAVSPYVIKYVARLVRATRPVDDASPDFVKEFVDWGGRSPSGTVSY